jgi:hypothetical protein
VDIDAQTLLRRGTQKAFGIDGARQVIVKVAAFRHRIEKRTELERTLAQFGETTFDGRSLPATESGG